MVIPAPDFWHGWLWWAFDGRVRQDASEDGVPRVGWQWLNDQCIAFATDQYGFAVQAQVFGNADGLAVAILEDGGGFAARGKRLADFGGLFSKGRGRALLTRAGRRAGGHGADPVCTRRIYDSNYLQAIVGADMSARDQQRRIEAAAKIAKIAKKDHPVPAAMPLPRRRVSVQTCRRRALRHWGTLGLLFTLRQVAATDLLAKTATGLASSASTPISERTLAADDIGALFGLEIDQSALPPLQAVPVNKTPAARVTKPAAKKPTKKPTKKPR